MKIFNKMNKSTQKPHRFNKEIQSKNCQSLFARWFMIYVDMNFFLLFWISSESQHECALQRSFLSRKDDSVTLGPVTTSDGAGKSVTLNIGWKRNIDVAWLKSEILDVRKNLTIKCQMHKTLEKNRSVVTLL